MKNTAAWAREIARQQLETPLPRRWAHTQGVARQARTLAPILGHQADLLEAAAWLHDIGYAPDLATTGFHPLDGARYLRDTHQADNHLCRLVAHHTCALAEARERGLAESLISEFGEEPPELSDQLVYCDMTAGPSGEQLSVEDRLTEILSRYDANDPVARYIAKCWPHMIDTVRRTHNELLKGAHEQGSTVLIDCSLRE
ncbi:HD domain-containing protein [Spirillospora sp. CA-294931]|uniref:HD domain-containing protein n=1 Tax=Spirillospora sp. CA-294931 TaxID=3240042 RepID=UPI003D92243F